VLLNEIGLVGGIDPMAYTIELPLRRVFCPLGFAMEVETNSPEILAAIEETWGTYRQTFPDPPIRLRLGVHDVTSEQETPAPVFRGQFKLVSIISDQNNFAVCDMERGTAYGWFARLVAADGAFLRYHFLSAIVHNLLLAPLYLTIVHAAFVALDGQGVLLCGDSGAGKSSLAYACARRGWTFLSDDASYLLRRRSDRTVIGYPHLLRFKDTACGLFPELDRRLAARRPNGKLALELRTADLPEIRTATECVASKIVFLRRNGGSEATVTPFPKAKALEWFVELLSLPHVRAEQEASLKNLLSADVFEMQYEDLDSAVARLEQLVRNPEATLLS
jgi:hypothetical protein